MCVPCVSMCYRVFLRYFLLGLVLDMDIRFTLSACVLLDDHAIGICPLHHVDFF